RLPPEARFLRAHQPLDAERIASLVGGGPGRREVKAARDFQHPVCAPASRRTLERADGPQENTLGPLLFSALVRSMGKVTARFLRSCQGRRISPLPWGVCGKPHPAPPWGRGCPAPGAFTSRSRTGGGALAWRG